MNTPSSTRDVVAQFSACLFEPADLVEVRAIWPPDGRKQEWHKAAELADAAEHLVEMNRVGKNVYIGANPRRRRGGATKDVAIARSMFADFDRCPSAAEAAQRWRQAGLPEPTMVVASGHGIHPYWRFTEPLPQLKRWSALQARLIGALGTDPVVKDPPRVMRLPGFLNCKQMPRVPCEIVSADSSRRFDLAELERILGVDATSDPLFDEHGASENLIRSSVPSVPLSHDTIEAVIAKCLPTGPHERHFCVFALARQLKALPALTDAPATALRPIVERWHRAALPLIETKPFEESWFEFGDAWDDVKYPAGSSPLEAALLRASSVAPPAVATRYEQEPLRMLVAWCCELQRAACDQPFFLSCRSVERFLDVRHQTAARWLRGLVRDGVLVESIKGDNVSRKASRYRYLGGD